MPTVKRLLLPTLGVLCLLTAGVRPASADTITYALTTGNSAISGYPGPYGNVAVNLTSGTTADITFTGGTNATYTYLFGDGGSAAVNVNAGSFGVSNITGTSLPGFTPNGPYSYAGAGTEDGLGAFNATINTFDGFTHASNSLSFTLTRNDSGTWTSAAQVLTPDADGYVVGAHIFVCTNPCSATGGALATGYAVGGNGQPPTVPEPATLTLVGAGLAFVGRAYRRRKQQR